MCEFLNLNIHQGVITAKSFQHTINNWSGMVNLHVSKKCFFGGNIQISEYKTTLNYAVDGVKCFVSFTVRRTSMLYSRLLKSVMSSKKCISTTSQETVVCNYDYYFILSQKTVHKWAFLGQRLFCHNVSVFLLRNNTKALVIWSRVPKTTLPPRQLYRAFICGNVLLAGRVKVDAA